MKEKKIDTKCVQAGWQPESGQPRQVPITQSTTFKYDSAEELGDLFALKKSGYFYTRLQNPTNDSVAEKICQMEGGAAAILTSSGQAASFFSVFNIAGSGDHVVCSSEIYGGTYNLFNVTMRRMGIDFTFVSPDASDEVLEKAFKENTKAFFGESISNPSLTVLDLERVSKIAHKNGVPVIIDNTFPTPVHFRPFEHGADIVTHSTTKYMDGHGSSVGGVVVDSGNFDWDKYKDKYPGLTSPDPSYNNIVYTEAFGKGAYITKMVAQLMRDFGSIPSPFNSFILSMNLEDLHLRIDKHTENALKLAEYLESREEVEKVHFPGLKGDKYYDLAKELMPRGTCGVISFNIKGGRREAQAFLNSLKLINIATHVADARSCALHPASTTHSQLTDEELEKSGIQSNLIRLSCGIEDPDDLIEDLSQAFDNYKNNL